ncbi:Ig-like domain-containing protein [Lactiplantibacillus plantarum]
MILPPSRHHRRASIKVGDTRKITITTEPADADDSTAVIAAVTWKSSDDSKATVAADGTITAVAEGTATVTATSGEFTTDIAVTVTASE